MEGREPVSPVYSAVMSLRARVEMRESRPAAAERYLRRAADWVAGLEPSRPMYLSTLTMRIAETLLAQGRDDDARTACLRSLLLAEQSGAEDLARRRQELEELGCL